MRHQHRPERDDDGTRRGSSLDELALSLLRVVRGRRSQAALNRRLGYRSNQIHRWESGEREIPWPRFQDLCSACRCELRGPLRNALLYQQPAERSDLLVEHLLLGRALKDAAARVGASYHTLRRWLMAQSTPSLNDVLRLMDLAPGQLESFVARFCARNGLALPDGEPDANAAAVRLLLRYPIAGALTSALELRSYQALARHDSGWLARRLDVTEAEVDECLSALEERGLVRMKQGRYVSSPDPIDTSGFDPRERLRLRAYWYQKLVSAILSERLELGLNFRGTYFVHALSRTAAEQVSERLRQAFRDIDVIIRDDRQGEKEALYYVGLDQIGLGDLEESPSQAESLVRKK